MSPGPAASTRFVGAFEFSDRVDSITDETLDALRGWGVDTLLTESDSYDPDAIKRVRDAGLRFFAGLSAFSDHGNENALLAARPELHPIDETGRRRPQMEWYVGITPSVADHRRERAETAERIVREHPVDGLMLDFVRWPLHWELELRPGAPRPLASSFDPITLADFSSWSGIGLPDGIGDGASAARWIISEARDAWTAYRCAVITRFVEDVAARVRAIRPAVTIGAFVVPLPPAELAEAVGQDVQALGRVLDLLAPMCYHAIVHRDARWVGETTTAIAAASGPADVAPVVQVDSTDGPASGADWGPPVTTDEWWQVLEAAWTTPGATGLIAFPAGALARDGRGARLANLTGAGR